MQQKSLLILIISLIIALGLGVFIGSSMSKKLPQGVDKKSENTYQSGWDAAMNTMKESGAIPSLPEGVEITSLAATIQSIQGNTLTVKVSDPTLLTDSRLQTRTITINNTTKIQKYVQKDANIIAQETQSFDEKMKAYNPEDNQELPTPPSYQDIQESNVSELKEGQQIIITASEDIRNKESIIATEIQLQVTPESSPAADAIDLSNLPTTPQAPAQGQSTQTTDINDLPQVPAPTVDIKESATPIDINNLPTPPSIKKTQ